MQVHVGVCGQELINKLGLVGREVVDDDVDLFSPRLRREQIRKEAHELGGGVAGGGLADDFTAFGVESRVQTQRPMAHVLEAMALGPAGGERQNRIDSIQGLNSGLFVHAEDGGMGRRVEIEPDDIGRLGFEIRVVRYHVTLEAMRPQSVLGPDASDGHMTEAKMFAKFARAPMRRAIRGRTSRRLQDFRFKLGSEEAWRLAGIAAHHSAQAFRREPLLPHSQVGRAATESVNNLLVGFAIGQCQDDARPLGQRITNPLRRTIRSSSSRS